MCMLDLNKVVIADLHIHSRFSRACSKNITLESLEKWARIKGLGLLGTGDFTHPEWIKEIKENLKEKDGILLSETGFRFVLSGEVSLMYTQERGRRIHLVLLAPNFEAVDKINAYFDTKGRRDYDGRPIFKIPADVFVKDMHNISKDIEIICAHALTPWFGIFGSKSGFDSLKEAFKEQEKEIHAVESGMSASPEMLWHLPFLNNKAIVSFSDSHSFWPWRIGREATIFNKVDSYKDLIEQIRGNTIIGTIETDPGYGIYHYDGHKDCNFSSSPEETRKLNGICPVCGKPLTIGVENRVEQLTNQSIEEHPNKKVFYKLLPLHELISLAKASALAGRKTWEVYNSLIEKFGNELNILLNIEKEDLIKAMPNDNLLIDLIMQNRDGKIRVKPGFDGKYGEPMLSEKQENLNRFSGP